MDSIDEQIRQEVERDAKVQASWCTHSSVKTYSRLQMERETHRLRDLKRGVEWEMRPYKLARN